MSKRTRASRKRRPVGGARAGNEAATATEQPEKGSRSPKRRNAEASERAAHKRERRNARSATAGNGPIAVSRTYGERPHPPWHPLPLAELLILVGAVALVLAFNEGVETHWETLLAGIAAIALGTFEVTLREHRSGYRSHTTMLAALPVLIFHSVTLLIVSILTSASRYINLGLFAVDLVLFVLLFRALRSNFLTARTRASIR